MLTACTKTPSLICVLARLRNGPRPEIGSGLCCESCPQSRKFLVARTLHGVEALATLNAY